MEKLYAAPALVQRISKRVRGGSLVPALPDFLLKSKKYEI